YANYRGALMDSQGKAWFPLDPGFKRLQPVSGLDVVKELGFDPRAALDGYLAAPNTLTPLEQTRAQIADLRAQQKPDTRYSDVLTRRELIPQPLGMLPSTLPYPGRTLADVGFDLPEELNHTLVIAGELDGRKLFEETFSISDLLGRRFTLSYVPFSPEDETVVAAYGGLLKTPPYLIDVKPVLKSGGIVVASGSQPIGMAVKYTLKTDFRTPAGTESLA